MKSQQIGRSLPVNDSLNDQVDGGKFRELLTSCKLNVRRAFGASNRQPPQQLRSPGPPITAAHQIRQSGFGPGQLVTSPFSDDNQNRRAYLAMMEKRYAAGALLQQKENREIIQLNTPGLSEWL